MSIPRLVHLTLFTITTLGISMTQAPSGFGEEGTTDQQSKAPSPRQSPLVAVDETEFYRVVDRDAEVVKLAGELRFTEGPVWIDHGGYLLFSDIPANAILRFKNGKLSVFRKPSHHSNGLSLDERGASSPASTVRAA